MKEERRPTEIYDRENLYSADGSVMPPSERKDHVVRFQLTSGCDWNKCTFCSGYEGEGVREKEVEEYEEHVESVLEALNGYGSDESLYFLKRIFIGAGNALSADNEKLSDALHISSDHFSGYAGRLPTRISFYGRTRDINDTGTDGLNLLESSTEEKTGLLIYWGVESGSSEVLDYVKKGCKKEDHIKAAEKLKNTDIETSIMIMPGLGGMKYYDQHIEDTAEVIGEIEPDFITFMGVNPDPGCKYSSIMQEEKEKGENRPLNDEELTEQMATIIEQMPAPSKRCRAGCFDTSIDKVGYNPKVFGSQDIRSDINRKILVRGLRRTEDPSEIDDRVPLEKAYGSRYPEEDEVIEFLQDNGFERLESLPWSEDILGNWKSYLDETNLYVGEFDKEKYVFTTRDRGGREFNKLYKFEEDEDKRTMLNSIDPMVEAEEGFTRIGIYTGLSIAFLSIPSLVAGVYDLAWLGMGVGFSTSLVSNGLNQILVGGKSSLEASGRKALEEAVFISRPDLFE